MRGVPIARLVARLGHLLIINRSPLIHVTIAPGTRLGPYEVTAFVGEGGMGKVYRAIDTNLKRSVAIKVFQTRSLPIPNGSLDFSVKLRSWAD